MYLAGQDGHDLQSGSKPGHPIRQTYGRPTESGSKVPHHDLPGPPRDDAAHPRHTHMLYVDAPTPCPDGGIRCPAALRQVRNCKAPAHNQSHHADADPSGHQGPLCPHAGGPEERLPEDL